MKQSFLLRVPEQKFVRLKKLAKSSGVSINEYLNSVFDQSTALTSVGSSGIHQIDQRILDRIKAASFSTDLVAIILFGSMAKGTETEASDCDLLLVLSSAQKITRKLYTLWDNEVENGINASITAGREINPHFVGMPKDLSEVHSLWLEVALSGIVIWKRDCEIDNQLQKIRLAIASGGFQRKVTHGQPYWIRKEDQLIT
jgi:predicted nucleotidyltransferase